jgi:predicted transcriptional regulator
VTDETHVNADEMMDESLAHYGILRRSGRYPWGSGENPYQNNMNFLAYVSELQKKGWSEKQIAEGLGTTTGALRDAKKIAKTANRAADQSQAQRLKERGWSNVAIGQRMGINESSVRQLLAPSNRIKNDKLQSTANAIQKRVDEVGYIDVGAGTELYLGVSATQLKTAVTKLREEGYTYHYVDMPQLGTGKDTLMKVLAKPGIDGKTMYANKHLIEPIAVYSEDGGRTFLGIEKPKQVDLNRIEVRYGPDGGDDRDGIIQLRRGVDDISLGASKYAQVRIQVDDTHYLKGMAVYTDDLPDGVDIRFNTNKTREEAPTKLDAMKPLKSDEDNPFGAVVRQKHYLDKDGKRQLSALNIVGAMNTEGGEEGAWRKWSRNLSSQMLSKQSAPLAKQQLGIAGDRKRADLDEILALNNPAVKKKLLDGMADDLDAAAAHLKAAGLPRTASHVLLPLTTIKETEIYAPNYRDGERVVLIRHPHGGTFEIPELTVNNRNREAGRIMKGAQDAVGINPKVAQQLSGADFDGDTVLVIPNNNKAVKTSSPLEGLRNFDPKTEYREYPGMKRMSSEGTQLKMGDISNLITDMTIQDATEAELARAVRHSMVVIDAEKHGLNYQQSAKDHGIAELKRKYQGDARAGAATLISRATSQQRVDARKPRPAADGGPVDPETGERRFVPTGETYERPVRDRKTKEIIGTETVKKTLTSTKMAETTDARTLSSGTVMEGVYADHANRLKAMANEARKASLAIKPIPQSASAKTAYAKEVSTLRDKLDTALRNKPLERRAQTVANMIVKAKRDATPSMDAADRKKIAGQALAEARLRVGAHKARVVFTPREWEAVQAGAISNSFLTQLLSNADLNEVRQLATPRDRPAISAALLARAQTMLSSGNYSQADVADALGVSVSTLNTALHG